MLIFIIWIILALIIGGIGSERKIGWTGAFFAALLLSPLIGILIVLSSERKSDIAYKEKMLRYIQQRKDYDNESFDVTPGLEEFAKIAKHRQHKENIERESTSSLISKYGIYAIYVIIIIGIIIYLLSTPTYQSVDFEKEATILKKENSILSPIEDLILRIKSDGTYTRNEIDETFTEIGTINTRVDGEDVLTVNLWNATKGSRQPNTTLSNGTQVCIMGQENGYLLVGTSRSPVFQWGYCLPEFVKRNN